MKRLLACLALVTLFVLSFPALVSYESRNITGISSIANAGRMIPNNRWCECGTAGCICDPGELPGGGQGLTVQPNAPEESDPINSVDLSATFSLMVAAAFLVLRLRQI